MRPGAGRERGPADGACLPPLAPRPRRGLPEENPRTLEPLTEDCPEARPPPPSLGAPLHPPQ